MVPSQPDDALLSQTGIRLLHLDDAAEDTVPNELLEAPKPKLEVASNVLSGGIGPVWLKVWKVAVGKAGLGTRSVVVEPYVSTDWNDEYSKHYSRLFLPPNHTPWRLHFFAQVLGRKDGRVIQDDLWDMPKEVRDAYRGYVVIRPLSGQRVGDTLLATPCKTPNGHHLVHALARFNVCLLGNTLTVEAMPFMEQESRVDVCAEADLWMVARYLNRLGEVRRYRPSEIFELATARATSDGLGIARDGLNLSQAADAMKTMGLSPRVWSNLERYWQATREFIYSCVESAIPVVIGVPGHVVTAIGHDLAQDPTVEWEAIDEEWKKALRKWEEAMEAAERTWDQKNGLWKDSMSIVRAQAWNRLLADPTLLIDGLPRLKSVGACIQTLIVHDDARGPYESRKIEPQKSNNGLDAAALEIHGVVDYCLTALPVRVHLEWHDVCHATRVALVSMPHMIAHRLRQYRKDGESDPENLNTYDLPFSSKQLSAQPVRIYLRISAVLKKDWLDPKNDKPPELRKYYIALPMPKYVWVVEITDLESFQPASPDTRKICGEIIFDATASFDQTLDVSSTILAFHYRSLLYMRQRTPLLEMSEIVDCQVPDITYSPLLR